MKKNILIVEDEMIIALDIKNTLKKNNFNVIGISNSHKQTIVKINDSLNSRIDVDLILMDINISGPTDGIQSCNIIYQKYKIPIIFLSAHKEEDTLEMIKDSYAKAYFTKPIKYEELLIAIHFIINKNSKSYTKGKEKVELKNCFSFNLEKKSLYHDNKEILLTRKEKKLIYLLCKNKNNYVSYESLFSYVWEKDIVNISKIRGSIFRIKRKVPFLEIANSKECGYKLE
ncbi:response regulator [Halarcobacter ebronensis]|uniref:DNA-binding response regulator n=1 Tax=Halarcobacter ebronensis TaxID=1462615 RepID=A0A4Q1AN67_9BACT|nr:response regulator [Halarcobacter ebronensis]QKF82423.1 signal transduction response regulator [Halarcobacter ebronensis]RXK07554.1 hypothetical protein CRV07_03585 [Halarcobacter ebronensis]